MKYLINLTEKIRTNNVLLLKDFEQANLNGLTGEEKIKVEQILAGQFIWLGDGLIRRNGGDKVRLAIHYLLEMINDGMLDEWQTHTNLMNKLIDKDIDIYQANQAIEYLLNDKHIETVVRCIDSEHKQKARFYKSVKCKTA